MNRKQHTHRLSKKKEQQLIDLMKKGETHCYFCNIIVKQNLSESSTEYGIFWACTECFSKYGNPDEYLENELWPKSWGL